MNNIESAMHCRVRIEILKNKILESYLPAFDTDHAMQECLVVIQIQINFLIFWLLIFILILRLRLADVNRSEERMLFSSLFLN